MELSFERPSGGRGYLLVCQRGVLSEQLREVRDPGAGSRVDPFLLYGVQLLERGRGVGGRVELRCAHTHTQETHPTVHILFWALLIMLKLQTTVTTI